MSTQDLIRKLRRNADDVEHAAAKEQGTLRAYWIGFSAGLRTVIKDLQGQYSYEQISEWIGRPKPENKPEERCPICGARQYQSTACRGDFHEYRPKPDQPVKPEAPSSAELGWSLRCRTAGSLLTDVCGRTVFFESHSEAAAKAQNEYQIVPATRIVTVAAGHAPAGTPTLEKPHD